MKAYPMTLLSIKVYVVIKIALVDSINETTKCSTFKLSFSTDTAESEKGDNRDTNIGFDVTMGGPCHEPFF